MCVNLYSNLYDKIMNTCPFLGMFACAHSFCFSHTLIFPFSFPICVSVCFVHFTYAFEMFLAWWVCSFEFISVRSSTNAWSYETICIIWMCVCILFEEKKPFMGRYFVRSFFSFLQTNCYWFSCCHSRKAMAEFDLVALVLCCC